MIVTESFKTTKNGNGKMARSLELERRHYYRKVSRKKLLHGFNSLVQAMGLLAVGIGIIALGIAFSVIYFLNKDERKNIMMAGPICLAVGLLGIDLQRLSLFLGFSVFICAMVWIPIIKTKLKKKLQQQKSQNRYGI